MLRKAQLRAIDPEIDSTRGGSGARRAQAPHSRRQRLGGHAERARCCDLRQREHERMQQHT